MTRQKSRADQPAEPLGSGPPAAAHAGPAPQRPVDGGRARKAQATFALRLDPAVVAELRRIAEVQAIGPTQLVRSWVLERLEIEHGGPTEPGAALIVERVLAALRPRVNEVVRQAIAEQVGPAAVPSSGGPGA